MTAQQLKNSILQMAVQGKLVPQNPDDEPASVLLQRIKAEKQELIKAGKIKKDKKSSEIFRGASRNLPYAFCEQIGKEIRDISDEIPFEIPDSWEWCRVSELSYLTSGNQYDEKETGIPYLKVADMNLPENQYEVIKSSRFVDSNNKGLIPINSIIFPKRGGAIATNKKKEVKKFPVFVDSNTMGMTVLLPQIFDYVKKWFDSIDLGKLQSGTSVPQINNKDIEPLLFPLPPLSEQKRIVTKIEELLPYIERYGKAEEHLTELNTKFPEALKKSILQEAVQGKLVPQNPDDEPASVLLERIKAEKQKLIKEGKIKKEKPIAPITEDEILFDIPESWEWCRVGEIFSHNTGKAMNSSAKKTDKSGDIRKFITTSNVYWNRIDFNNVKEMFFSDDELARCTVTKGDMVMCEGGAYYGRTAIWNYDYDICFQNHVHRLRAYKELCTLFYYYTFYFYRNNGMMESKGTAMPGLSSVVLHNILIPLPPLEEQKRIVAKIEELMQYCDKL